MTRYWQRSKHVANSVQIKSTSFSTPCIGGVVEIYISYNKQKKSESGITSAIKTLDPGSRQWIVGCFSRRCVTIRRTHFTETYDVVVVMCLEF